MQDVGGCESSVSRGNTFLMMRWCFLWCFLLCPIYVGCSGSKPIEPAPPSELTASAEERKEPLPVTELQPLDSFEVPKLSDLDKEANWIERPVRDGLVLLREAQSKEKVLGSVAVSYTHLTLPTILLV